MHPETDASTPSSTWRVVRWVASLGVLALAGVLVALGVRWYEGRHDLVPVCRALEQSGVVTECRSRRTRVALGVQVEQVVRFDVRTRGRRAYRGMLVRLRDEKRLKQFVDFARSAHEKSARKTAAATEIGSEGRIAGVGVLGSLKSIQVADSDRYIVADLMPVYGGPLSEARNQVEAIRKALTR